MSVLGEPVDVTSDADTEKPQKGDMVNAPEKVQQDMYDQPAASSAAEPAASSAAGHCLRMGRRSKAGLETPQQQDSINRTEQ